MSSNYVEDDGGGLLGDYLSSETLIPCAGAIVGILACKMVYDLSQMISEAQFKSYFGLSSMQKVEWNNRAISTFHALFITIWSVYFVFWSDLYDVNVLTTAVTFRSSPASTFGLAVSSGYFLTDLAMILWFYPSLGGMEYVVHHLLSMSAVTYAMLTREGQLYTFMVLISETTTPSMNLRWYLDSAGLKKSRVYLVNGFVMFLAWLVARIILFIYVFYHIYLHYNEIMQMQKVGICLVLVAPCVIYVLNLIWFGKISRGLKKTLTTKKRRD
ncbi:TLC domain-containing protein 4-B-like [Impatiens glandulifera]|uniref:TLC domain-containing protein 4-B-like n=1 Tax=Impatiens glandulifera TaxID=253017 RepID=UPI001FB0C74D|nr:TLC domain-containing protein 4-B-like [Impatiens glandulifera]XP_047336607.1 TLC domain-containing protein 4-B-like [Impatiens glandulifera]